MSAQPETALRASEKKRKGKGIVCWHCDKKGHMKTKCRSWLNDTDEGRKYAKEHPDSESKAKTGPLPTPGAKGNLSIEKAQVASESTGDIC
jgi:hypothetical protein